MSPVDSRVASCARTPVIVTRIAAPGHRREVQRHRRPSRSRAPRSAIGGSVELADRAVDLQLDRRSAPSAGRRRRPAGSCCENVIGCGDSNCTHCPPTPTNGVFHAVAGLPSAALVGAALQAARERLAGARGDRRRATPSAASIAASAAPGSRSRCRSARTCAAPGSVERARDRQLGIGARRHRAQRVAAHHEHERVRRAARAERVEEVLRHLLDLVDAHVVVGVLVAQADLGEADGVGARRTACGGGRSRR